MEDFAAQAYSLSGEQPVLSVLRALFSNSVPESRLSRAAKRSPDRADRTEIEICDEFWPYTKEGSSVQKSDFAQYRKGIIFLLSKRSCIECEFTGADESFAAELFGRKIPLTQVEKAIALACCRKYAGLLNGTDAEMIHRFSYFRDSIEEILDPEPPPIQAEFLDQRILTAEYLEAKWLAMGKSVAGAKSAQAPSKAQRDEMMLMIPGKLGSVAEE